jgi:hypothetical protein
MRGPGTQGENRRLGALERKVDMIAPQITREIMSQVRGMLGQGAIQPTVPQPVPRTRQQGRNYITETVETKPPPRPTEEEWVLVRPRKERKKVSYAAIAATPARIPPTGVPSAAPRNTKRQIRRDFPPLTMYAREEKNRHEIPPGKAGVLPRNPRSSAVTVTLQDAAKTTYAEVIAKARERIPLKELGVTKVEMRRGVTGSVIIRLPGDKNREKATMLASRLANVLDPMAVWVVAPVKRAEIKVEGIDISMGKEELRQAVSNETGCKTEEVIVGDIIVMKGGLGTAWVKCPVAGARRLAATGKLAVGWSYARVTAVPKRPLQCFRCLEIGHVRATCPSAVDRSSLCHRCGKEGHMARTCTAVRPNCPLCEALGVPAEHRMGGIACAPPKTSKRTKKNRRDGREIPAKRTASGQEEAMVTE